MKKVKDEYVNNKEFISLLAEYKETKSKRTFEKLGKIFLEISQRYLFRPNAVNYSQDIKNDTISDACYTMVRYMDRFDPERSNNAFAYFTQIARNCFLQNLKHFKRRDETFTTLDFVDNLDDFVDGVTIKESVETVDTTRQMSQISKYF